MAWGIIPENLQTYTRILSYSILLAHQDTVAMTELCYTYSQPWKEIQKSISASFPFTWKDKANSTPDLIGEAPRWRASAHLRIKDSCFILHLHLHSHKLITFFLPMESFGTWSEFLTLKGDFYSQSCRPWGLSTGLSPVPGHVGYQSSTSLANILPYFQNHSP